MIAKYILRASASAVALLAAALCLIAYPESIWVNVTFMVFALLFGFWAGKIDQVLSDKDRDA